MNRPSGSLVNPAPNDGSRPPLRFGVALGGGSARGYAHIGALASLERHGFVPQVIAGTSFGAVIGAVYASGRSPAEMRAMATRLRRRDVLPHVADFGLHKAALFSGARLETYFERMLEGRHFSDLEKKLVVVATDVDTGERVLIRQGSLARALRASTSLPGFFCPVDVQGRRLVDGGIGTPIPLDTLDEEDLDLAIGVGAGVESRDSGALRVAQRFLYSGFGRRVHQRLARGSSPHALARLGRALAFTADSWLKQQDHGDRLHVQTRPPISWLNFHQAERAIHAGEQALEKFLPQLRTAVAGLV